MKKNKYRNLILVYFIFSTCIEVFMKNQYTNIYEQILLQINLSV